MVALALAAAAVLVVQALVWLEPAAPAAFAKAPEELRGGW